MFQRSILVYQKLFVAINAKTDEQKRRLWPDSELMMYRLFLPSKLTVCQKMYCFHKLLNYLHLTVTIVYAVKA